MSALYTFSILQLFTVVFGSKRLSQYSGFGVLIVALLFLLTVALMEMRSLATTIIALQSSS
jgi:hypothetical protein